MSRTQSPIRSHRVALAETLDHEGRHDEAIAALAEAGQSGDAEALAVLGLRLVTGRHAPFLPADGARLLSDAAAAGSAEAAERLAVLLGGGFFVRQTWSTALDLLLHAAELGSASAQAQLAVLAAGPGAAEPATGSWRPLRDAVDLKAWTAAPPTAPLNASPRIVSVKHLIGPAACDWVIAESAPRLVRAELYDPDTGRSALGAETRLNRIANFGLADTNLLNLMIQARISAAAGIAQPMMEAFAVLHYTPGEAYGEHFDFLDPATPAYAAELARAGQRIATCLVYLNEDYEGGHTEFPRLEVSFKGGRGDALIFFSVDAEGRPDRRTVHAGRPPSSGEKWLLSQFFRDRPAFGGPTRAF